MDILGTPVVFDSSDPNQKKIVTLELSSSEAETILFALTLRSKQRQIGDALQGEALSIGDRLNQAFERTFGWMKYDRMRANREKIKHVSLTRYDLPPKR